MGNNTDRNTQYQQGQYYQGQSYSGQGYQGQAYTAGAQSYTPYRQRTQSQTQPQTQPQQVVRVQPKGPSIGTIIFGSLGLLLGVMACLISLQPGLAVWFVGSGHFQWVIGIGLGVLGIVFLVAGGVVMWQSHHSAHIQQSEDSHAAEQTQYAAQSVQSHQAEQPVESEQSIQPGQSTQSGQFTQSEQSAYSEQSARTMQSAVSETSEPTIRMTQVDVTTPLAQTEYVEPVTQILPERHTDVHDVQETQEISAATREMPKAS